MWMPYVRVRSRRTFERAKRSVATFKMARRRCPISDGGRVHRSARRASESCSVEGDVRSDHPSATAMSREPPSIYLPRRAFVGANTRRCVRDAAATRQGNGAIEARRERDLGDQLGPNVDAWTIAIDLRAQKLGRLTQEPYRRSYLEVLPSMMKWSPARAPRWTFDSIPCGVRSHSAARTKRSSRRDL